MSQGPTSGSDDDREVEGIVRLGLRTYLGRICTKCQQPLATQGDCITNIHVGGGEIQHFDCHYDRTTLAPGALELPAWAIQDLERLGDDRAQFFRPRVAWTPTIIVERVPPPLLTTTVPLQQLMVDSRTALDTLDVELQSPVDDSPKAGDRIRFLATPETSGRGIAGGPGVIESVLEGGTEVLALYTDPLFGPAGPYRLPVTAIEVVRPAQERPHAQD